MMPNRKMRQIIVIFTGEGMSLYETRTPIDRIRSVIVKG